MQIPAPLQATSQNQFVFVKVQPHDDVDYPQIPTPNHLYVFFKICIGHSWIPHKYNST